VNPVIALATSLLAILTVWGLVAPRNQWRVLASWTRREPYANEPGAVAVGVQRLVAGIGVVVLIGTGTVAASEHFGGLDPAPQRLSSVEKMWGTPEPQVVNRVFTPAASVQDVLISQPVLGYQPVIGSSRMPAYLFSLDDFSAIETGKTGGEDDPSGYIGTDPPVGFSALDTADLVVEVRGDRVCLPRQVVVLENATTVKVAVYYGQPSPADGSNAANLTKCDPKAPATKSTPVLVPIDLAAPVDGRLVTTMDGTTKIPKVKVIDG
jgi:hypothetical protein